MDSLTLLCFFFSSLYIENYAGGFIHVGNIPEEQQLFKIQTQG